MWPPFCTEKLLSPCIASLLRVGMDDGFALVETAEPLQDSPLPLAETANAARFKTFAVNVPPASSRPWFADATSMFALALWFAALILNKTIALFVVASSTTAIDPPTAGWSYAANTVPSSCRYHELNALPVMLQTSALRVTVAVVVGM